MGRGVKKKLRKTLHMVYGWPLRWITWKYSITYVFPYWFDIRTTGWHAWETMIYGFDFERLSVPYILIVALKKVQSTFFVATGYYVKQVLLRNGIHVDKCGENRKWHSRVWCKKYHWPRKRTIIKNPQFSPNHHETWWNWPSHEKMKLLNIRLIRQKLRIFI